MRIEEFSAWLRAELEKQGMTRQDFADAVGYDVSSVKSWVAGRQLPRYEAFFNVLDCLGYKIEIVPK